MFIYQNSRSKSLIHNYDIAVGPGAEDNIIKTLKFYDSGEHTIDEAIKKLKTDLLSNQISFHTQASLSCLSYIKTIRIDDEGVSYD